MSSIVRAAPRRSLVEKLRLGLEILRTYTGVRRRLHKQGLRPTLAWLRRSLGDDPVASDSSALALGRAVHRTLAPIPADTRCLTQSLVLLGLLARRGIRATLVLGVESPGGKFGAHAWVEHERVPLLPPGTDVNKRLAEL